jgi:uncharacterized linocin/CFP29 family protein
MQGMRRIGLATGSLTTEEINHVEKAIVKTVRPMLIGRQLFDVVPLAHAGFRKYTYYTENDMGQAIIDMQGEEESQDLVDLTEEHVPIPIIHKEYTLHWRDVLMRREGGQDLNTQHAENAGRQVAEEEDKLLLTGEITAGTYAWPALGIKGLLASCPGVNLVNTFDGQDWNDVTHPVEDVSTAKQMLRALGFYGPYKLIVPSAVYSLMEKLQVGGAGSDKWGFQAVGELIGGVENILVSDNLIPTDGAALDSALLIDVQPGNFSLVVGSDLTNHLAQRPNMNYFGRVWEAVVPVIKRPNAIIEIHSLLA